MPVFQLGPETLFPPPELATPEGLLAVGGDLSPERLLHAYTQGIFPWFSAGEPFLWWSPDPRCVLLPGGLHVTRSLRKVMRKNRFSVTFDQKFAAVIRACAEARAETWILPEMEEAYTELHRRGFAHSVECWQDDRLVGGFYGIALGRCFCGESMFHRERDASKVAFVAGVEALFSAGYEMIDAQLPTEHLLSLGAVTLRRSEFLCRLQNCGVIEGGMPVAGVFPRMSVVE